MKSMCLRSKNVEKRWGRAMFPRLGEGREFESHNQYRILRAISQEGTEMVSYDKLHKIFV